MNCQIVIALLTCVTIASVSAAAPAEASERRARIVEKLHQQGFSRVEFDGRRIFGYAVNACLDGRQYRLFFDPFTVERRRRVTGNCRNGEQAGINLPELRRTLRAGGYREIAFVSTNPGNIVAEACRGEQRVSLELASAGEVRRERRIGRCGPGASEDPQLGVQEIRAKLRDQGLRRISFTVRGPFRYEAEACRKDRAVLVSINANGSIVHERDTGTCGSGNTADRPPSSTDVIARLRTLGFYAITPISRDEPPTRVEACKSGMRYDIRLTRDGEIESRQHMGECQRNEGLSVSDLRQRLSARGYYAIKMIDQRANRVAFDACRSIRQFRVIMDATGNLRRRQAIGWCPASGNIPERPRRIVGHFPSGSSLGPEDCDDYLDSILSQSSIRFETGSAEISRSSSRVLEEVGHVMKLCPRTTIEIAGHTDNVGTRADNQRLSRQRARSVVKYLVDQDGIRRDRLKAIGYGEDRPLRPNNSERHRALNRRIEMVVLWDD